MKIASIVYLASVRLVAVMASSGIAIWHLVVTSSIASIVIASWGVASLKPGVGV